MNTLQFFYRVVYGTQKAYPANTTADRFAALLGVKTFNSTQLLRIQELGFEIENVRDPETGKFASLLKGDAP